MSATFTLRHLIMACLLTAMVVSVLVTSFHMQWKMPSAAPIFSSSSFTNAGHDSRPVHRRVEQLSAAIALAKEENEGTPTATLTEQKVVVQPCPVSAPPAVSVISSVKAAVVGGSFGSEAAFDEYITLHKRILAKDPGVEQKFIIARPQAQLNNRLRVIIGGIALGMLTKRAFLIEFSNGYYADLADIFDIPIAIDLRHFDSSRISNSDHLSVNDVDSLLCADFATKYPSTSIDLGTPPNMIPFFWRNPNYQATLRQWFGSEEYIYRMISLRFLQPSSIVAGMRSKFLTTQMDAPYKLGLHLRWGGDMRPQPVRDDEWTDMIECVTAVVPSQYRDSSSLAIFVAADTPESRARAQSTLQARFPKARILFYEQWLRSNTVGGVQAALTEMLLLAECDNLVLTPASSYSETAMALNGKPAYFLQSTVPNPARIQFSVTHEIAKNCMRPFSTQPTVEHFSKDIQRAKCYHPDMHGISF